MNEQHTEQTAEQGSENGQERLPHMGSFLTLDEAKAVTPPSSAFRTFTVTDPGGAKVYVWAQGTGSAISVAAKNAGWKAEVAEPKGTALTKDRVAAKLAELSDAELAEMGLTRKKGKR